MAVFFSLVGYQPTAVAVPLAICHEQGTVDQVVLLPTTQVKNQAERLATWCQDTYSLDCKIVEVSGSWVDEGQCRAAHTVIAEWLRRFSPQQMLFNAEPGLNFQVAAIARLLPDSTRFLYPMADSLWSSVWMRGREYWQHWPLVDLGLEPLLKLYDVSRLSDRRSRQATGLLDQLQEACAVLPQRLTAGLRLQGRSSEVVFDVAFEREGYLHGLACIEGVGDAVRDAVRAVERIPNEFRGLRPRMAIWTQNRAAANRLRRTGHHVLFNENELLAWAEGRVAKPGAHGPVLSEQPMASEVREILSKQHRGQGGDGPCLALCVGNDPSATVLSLSTHQPQRAMVFYDSQTPFIVEAAHRLARQAAKLPVGILEFHPSDHLGRDIHAQVTHLTAGTTIRVDVTPGSKAQACALARVPNAEIWSLAQHVGRALRLGGPGESLSLNGPPLLVLAQARGGDILDPGIVPTQRMKHSCGFLAGFLARHLAESGRRDVLKLFEERQDLDYEWGHLRFRTKGKDRWIALRLENQTARLPSIRSDGRWFEWLVGVALQEARADEVRCQVKWRWPAHWLEGIQRAHERKGIQPRQPPYMDEVDVLARFGHHVVAVSCKAGENVSWQKAKREIEAVASATMGRFCLPVLARTRLNEKQRAARSLTRQGAIFIDLQDLADPQALRSVIDEAFKARSTLAN